jgi:ribosomal protein S10
MFLKLEAARAEVAAEADAQAEHEEADAPLSATDRAILDQLKSDIREQVQREGSIKAPSAAPPSAPTKPNLAPVRSRPRPNKE